MNITMCLHADEIITALGLLGAGIAFFYGIHQYRTAQQWKKLEFLVIEIKEFDADPSVIVAKQILDWNARTIDISKGDGTQLVTVSDSLLERALLRIPEQREEHYTDLEVAIRDNLDVFFDRLDRFEAYIDSGLFSYESFHPYLSYWLGIIANPESRKKPQCVQAALISHVKCYFPGSTSLLKRYQRHMPR